MGLMGHVSRCFIELTDDSWRVGISLDPLGNLATSGVADEYNLPNAA